MKNYRLAVTLLAVAALATGCGGGGSNSALPASPNAPVQSGPGRGAAAFTITVPNATTGAGVKRPAYLSSNTMSVSIF